MGEIYAQISVGAWWLTFIPFGKTDANTEVRVTASHTREQAVENAAHCLLLNYIYQIKKLALESELENKKEYTSDTLFDESTNITKDVFC